MNKPIYFLASLMSNAEVASLYHDSILIAAPNIKTKKHIANIKRWIDQGKNILVDSGVFELCSHHAKTNSIQLNAALGSPPDSIDGFGKLLDHLMNIEKQLKNAFAIVEVDIGGKKHKRNTRAFIEANGAKVCPVFHPLIDGWDYLDELGEKYPCIFVGNVVDASESLRLYIIARLLKWKQTHQETWIHMLGVTPSPTALAMPMNSYDSSTWVASVRWPTGWKAGGLWHKVSGFDRDMIYSRTDKRISHEKSMHVSALDEACNAKCATHYANVLSEAGC